MNLPTSLKNNYLLAGLGLWVLLLSFNNILNTESAHTYPLVKHITPAEAFSLIDNDNVLVLDVREKDKYDREHIPGAVNVPLGNLGQRLQEFEAHKAEKIVVYCGEGSKRGPAATEKLNNAGYAGAHNLKGGIDAWRANSYQVVLVK